MPWEIEEKYVVVIGGNGFQNIKDLVVYRGAAVFTIERNVDSRYLAISFKIFDEDGHKIATIGQNRLFPNKKYKGDREISLEGEVHNFTVIEKPSGRMICNIRQKEKAVPAELDLSLNLYMPDGFLLSATPDGISIPGAVIKGSSFVGLGIRIQCPGEPTSSQAAAILLSVPAEFCRKKFEY
jgi:hypothetical protein